MFLIRILLFPVAVLYDAITRFRNRLYDVKIKPAVHFDIPVICVGNLSVGGTGKTPVIEYLIRLLGDKYKVAILSRGYKRKTKGFRIAALGDTATTLGDEPFQLYRKYGDKVKVVVGEDRAMAIPNLLQAESHVEVILLDDGFQHRSVTPSFSMVLTDYSKPFYTDFLLPAGRLRESRSNASRANVIIVTKCDVAITEQVMQEIKTKVKKYSQRPVFFTSIQYGQVTPFGNHGLAISKKVLLVTGIANPDSLLVYANAHFTLLDHLKFPDHHAYTANDLKKIEDYYHQHPAIMILTTEKDMVKLSEPSFGTVTSKLPFFYLPIEVAFVKDGKEFDELVLHSIFKSDS